MPARKTPGSPKPDKLMRDALALELNDTVKAEDGKEHKKLRLVARRLIGEALGGNVAAINSIMDRMDGKVPQQIKHQGDKDNPIEGRISIVLVDPPAIEEDNEA